MEGYSVTEAASVLGVPTERVWELLARGVLAGTPEGETGMRVFLQPRPAPAAPEPARPNGNGGDEPRRELSPFRELLTEFRNLTERYGQALLALGEARGEVAALRSRVDLLEARMDLRLPPGGAAGPPGGGTQPMPWAAPRLEPSERPHPAPDKPSSGAYEQEAQADAEPRTLRRDSPRRATESFAEALARAQDPSPPELPGGPETAAALSALRSVASQGAGSPDAALPRELPPADDVPVADEDARADATAPDDRTEEAAPVAALEPEPEPGSPTSREDEVAAADITTPEADASPDGRPAWQDERYTAEIGEPDWWEAEALPPAAARNEAPAADETSSSDEQEGDLGEDDASATRSADEAPADESGPLGDALAALEALSRATPPRPARPDAPRRATGPHSEASGPSSQRVGPQPPTPAGRAYRRLRRIFPG